MMPNTPRTKRPEAALAVLLSLAVALLHVRHAGSPSFGGVARVCATALVLVLAPIMLAVVVLDGHARRGAPRRLARRLATRECWRVCGGAETARSWRENAPVRRARALGNPPGGRPAGDALRAPQRPQRHPARSPRAWAAWRP